MMENPDFEGFNDVSLDGDLDGLDFDEMGKFLEGLGENSVRDVNVGDALMETTDNITSEPTCE